MCSQVLSLSLSLSNFSHPVFFVLLVEPRPNDEDHDESEDAPARELLEPLVRYDHSRFRASIAVNDDPRNEREQSNSHCRAPCPVPHVGPVHCANKETQNNNQDCDHC